MRSVVSWDCSSSLIGDMDEEDALQYVWNQLRDRGVPLDELGNVKFGRLEWVRLHDADVCRYCWHL